ncbi:MAG: hypothetical protein HYZ74_02025, partial [Elusimicrobia bacterium]|nr:hypothetical protein [Elusimicrobiota bacterium]
MELRRAAITAVALVAAVYGMARVDLFLRARSACLEGDKWMEWSRRPELKKAHFDAELAAREKILSADLAGGRLDRASY